MANPLAYIKSPIEEELKIFEDRFKDSVRSKVPLLDTIMNYISKAKREANASATRSSLCQVVW